MTAATAEQAEARLTLVLDYGNIEPAGEPIPAPIDQPTAIAKVTGKRQAIRDQAQTGALPQAPDFSKPTHARFRAKLAQIVTLAEAGDIAALQAFEINPVTLWHLARGSRAAASQHVLELGAGTGRNAEFFAAVIPALARLTLVDLCPSLLAQARTRAARWPNCAVVEADASHFVAQGVDRLLLSYALSMMPAWEAVLSRAYAMLQPGGLIGVVDFYVSEVRPAPGLVRHGALTRHLWPWWFGHDGVRRASDTLALLRARFEQVDLHEGLAAVPYMPGLRVPYFQFVGRRA